MQFIKANSKKDGVIEIPVYDVRESSDERRWANATVKAANGNQSKYIPGKWAFGPNGPKKY